MFTELAFVMTAALVAQQGAVPPEPQIDPRLLERSEFRLVGPHRGGRVTAVAGVEQAPFTFFMGSTGGGVWKSSNAGQTWDNVTDDFLDVGSIGAIAVAPSDPNVVYVGTGSACPRGNVSIGKGMWRSTDSGATWSHIGLDRAGLIGRVRVHPDDPDRLWVAVLGQIFGPSEERGVYRSDDGGKSWERVLFVSERTGVVDLSLHPDNARVLFAAAWTAERKPWTLLDGSEESGLYRSIDGGDSWQRLEKGLPTGVVGRIGVAVSPADPRRVWAVVAADRIEEGASGENSSGLYRSDDGGDSWQLVSDDRRLVTRAWYYNHVTADPLDRNTLWVNNVDLLRSIDGGATWDTVSTPHGDNHDLWIHPRHTNIMIQGNDGGANVSLDGGASWSTQLNQPTAEFYRLTVDNQFPFRLYGAQQDNSTISVPSSAEGDITPTQHWYSVAGAESGHIAVDPETPEIVYSGNYLGRIDRYDHRTGYSRNMILYPQMQDGTAPRDLRYRFQWNAPILISQHDRSVVYHTSNYVHRTTNGGFDWQTISPDLTRDDAEQQGLPGGPVQYDHTGVEVYNTIFALAESPLDARELWAGSDDGRLFVTTDGAANWREVTPPGLPADATINSIDLSRQAAGQAIVAAYRYRMDDWSPYVFRTSDGGRSWRAIVSGLPADHPVRVVREDPQRGGLLFAGTEFGLFASFDDGEHWQELQLNLPRTPITDLLVHRDDLVIATQGRSFWIFDDLELLRQLAADRPSSLRLFAAADGVRVEKRGFEGDDAPAAKDWGAVLWFWLPQSAAAEPSAETDAAESSELPPTSLEILDASGKVLRRFHSEVDEHDSSRPQWEELELTAGMNRFVWDLGHRGPQLADGARMSLSTSRGPRAVPGQYRARLTVGAAPPVETNFQVHKDPRIEASQEDLQQQLELLLALRERLTALHDRVRGLRAAREQSQATLERARRAGHLDADALSDFVAKVEAWAEQLTAAEEELMQVRHQVRQDPINFPPKIDNQYAYLYTHVLSSYGRPTAGSYQRFEDLEAEAAPLLAETDRLLGPELEVFNDLVGTLGLGGVLLPKPIAD